MATVAQNKNNQLVLDGVPSETETKLLRELVEKRKDPKFAQKKVIFYRMAGADTPWVPTLSPKLSWTSARVLIDEHVSIGQNIELEIGRGHGTGKHIVRIIAEVVALFDSPPHPDYVECELRYKKQEVRYRREDNFLWSLADLNRHWWENQTKDCTSHVVQDLAGCRDAYSLLYHEYASRKLCPPNASELHYSLYNLLPNTRTFLLKKEENLLGTLSLIPDSPLGLPMESTFPGVFDSLRKQGRRLAEAGCLALNSTMFNRGKYSFLDFRRQASLFKLIKILYDNARLYTGCTDIVLGCQPRHESLYKYLYYETISEVKPHKAAGSVPGLVMRCDLNTVIRHSILLNGGMEFFYRDPQTQDTVSDHFSWNSHDINKFVSNIKPQAQNLSQVKKDYLKSCYPELNIE